MVYERNKLSWVFKAVLIKLTTILLVSLSLRHLGVVELFKYMDFVYYAKGEVIYANFLYGIMLKLINATTISDPRLVFLSVVSAVIIDLLALQFLSRYYEISNKTLVAYGFFSLHPYFSVYALRLDTLDFASFACITFLFLVREEISNKKSNLFLWLLLFFAMFRASALSFLAAALISICAIEKKMKLNTIEIINLILLIISSLLIIRQNGSTYLDGIANASQMYNWSLGKTQAFWGEFGYFLDLIIHYATRLVILLGAREALYTAGYEHVISSNFGILQLSTVPVLAILHLTSFIFFIHLAYRLKIMIPVLISMCTLLGALVTVGHMRYLLAYQPMILLGFLYFMELKVFGKSRTNSSIPT